MNYHFIAIGGAVMHNLALELSAQGHHVTGSDDEIYEPSRSRLKAQNLLPEREGWFPERIHSGLDAVILGMHAKADNPELRKARSAGVRIVSFPEFIAQLSGDKRRVVIAGSHGKTTTTSMVMHVLKKHEMAFDYLVGAQLPGFKRMVRLSGAPLIIIEGDEYLSSAIDRRPKFLHYRPHLAVITGIAWDHANVFPTFEHYQDQFRAFLQSIVPGGLVCYYAGDAHLSTMTKMHSRIRSSGYTSYSYQYRQEDGRPYAISSEGEAFPMQIFGDHNFQNLKAAQLVCADLGIPEKAFLQAMQSFSGAQKRLQLLHARDGILIYRDFAHAPSKAEATVRAVRQRYPDHKLVACLELHTYSSLNKSFLPLYQHTLEGADAAAVFYTPRTLEIKRLPALTPSEIKKHFDFEGLQVMTETTSLIRFIKKEMRNPAVILFMSSGHFGGLKTDQILE